MHTYSEAQGEKGNNYLTTKIVTDSLRKCELAILEKIDSIKVQIFDEENL
jgi:hypothetical protein